MVYESVIEAQNNSGARLMIGSCREIVSLDSNLIKLVGSNDDKAKSPLVKRVVFSSEWTRVGLTCNLSQSLNALAID